MKYFIYSFLLIIVSIAFGQSREETIKKRLISIKTGFENTFFVKRFESIETPCLCLNDTDDTKATLNRNLNNSNYRFRNTHDRNHPIDSGVTCLSKYYARYAKFKVTDSNFVNQTLSGTVEFTYGYPASSIIQYLGFTHTAADPAAAFLGKLLKNPGKFMLYPENDKFRIWISMDGKITPYDTRDTIFGYIEIVKGEFRRDSAYEIFFDKKSIYKGDNNNQISIRFTSTTFDLEKTHYRDQLYFVLKEKGSPDVAKRAEAIWLNSFYSNPNCFGCQFIYNLADLYIKNMGISPLPNTEPLPAH